MPSVATNRGAVKSDEFVKRLASVEKASSAEKQSKIREIMADRRNGFLRLGQAMVGPIQVRLKYEGVIRNILVEDPFSPGQPAVYDIQDDLGVAYWLNGNEAEVKAQMFEGKRVQFNFFRCAAFPKVRKEDEYLLSYSTVEFAQSEAQQAIQKQEDDRLVYLLGQALTNYAANPKHTITPDHVVTETSGMLTPGALYTAASVVDEHQLESKTLLINTADARDVNRWEVNVTGWGFKDDLVDGMPVTKFGEFNFVKNIRVPRNNVYLLPEANYLGMFPVMYSLDVEENPKVEAFHRGWVMDELVGMVILNPRGIVQVVKS